MLLQHQMVQYQAYRQVMAIGICKEEVVIMKNVINHAHKMTAMLLAIGMLVTGIAVDPKQVEAEENAIIPNVVIYDESYSITDYWDDGKKAPVKEGYVFGGWFKEDADTTATNKETLISEDGQTTKICVPLTATDIDSATDEDNLVDEGVTAIAKFVPAQVLSVKAQNGVDKDSSLGKIDAATVTQISKENPMWVRVMTSQDSENYSKIGFDIYLANKKKPIDSADNDYILETNKVFEKVYVGDTLTDANQIFGEQSKYVCVWQIDKIDTPSNANKIIYVRPYWYTMDGTKVLGLAKYVHIEDDYKNYISVPVNITRTKDIAAGAINMTYDYEGLELAKDDNGNILFEKGRIFPDMEFHCDTAQSIIKMVGNEATVDTYANSDETIYANIRFVKPTTSQDTELNFNMNLVKFCDWTQTTLTNNQEVKVWDIAYEVKATNE